MPGLPDPLSLLAQEHLSHQADKKSLWQHPKVEVEPLTHGKK
ncbi:Uncharacterised protein [Chlamydia trachomatis]|nr:Uncharacterised protein [Chlamydia trachomatis]